MELENTQTKRQSEGVRLDHLTCDEKGDAEEGNRLISQLHTTVRAGQLYDSNNEGFSKQIEKLMDTMTALFQTEDIISLEVYMNYLFFNRSKIKTHFQNYIHTKFIIEILEKRNTEGMYFRPNISKEELSAFVFLMGRRDQSEKISFEDFQEQLSAKNIRNISIQKFSASTRRAAEERLMGIRRQAKQTFFETIFNLKGIMFKGKSERKAGARRIRRLVQSIVDLVAEDESYLIGLTTMKHYDQHILNHSVNVCILSVTLGQKVELEKGALRELGLAALFHDMGKMPHSSEISPKSTLSTEDERLLIERHPQYGVEMLMEMKSLGDLPVRAMKAILEHHLKFDMSGYPRLSERRELDLFSRIIAVTDYFDAVTKPQPSQPRPETPDRVLAQMMRESGRAFDPILVRLFVSSLGCYPVGSLVALDSGELAVIVGTHADPALLDRPMVKLVSDNGGVPTAGEIIDLTKIDPQTGRHARTIVKCLDPQKYRIDVFKLIDQ